MSIAVLLQVILTDRGNQYGKVLGLPSNRTILDSEGKPHDIIAGTFIVIGARCGHARLNTFLLPGS